MPISKDELGISRWDKALELHPASYECGYCGEKVSSSLGWVASTQPGGHLTLIRLCPNCWGPTLFTRDGRRVPSNAPGKKVPKVPDDLNALYEEARSSAAAGAYTGAVLLCRKMLMNIAVAQGAPKDKRFQDYVQFLADNNYIPPHGRDWVDYIRKRGNEATHEIALMTEQDAIALITFVEMLLRFIYEFPSMVPITQPGTQTP